MGGVAACLTITVRRVRAQDSHSHSIWHTAAAGTATATAAAAAATTGSLTSCLRQPSPSSSARGGWEEGLHSPAHCLCCAIVQHRPGLVAGGGVEGSGEGVQGSSQGGSSVGGCRPGDALDECRGLQHWRLQGRAAALAPPPGGAEAVSASASASGSCPGVAGEGAAARPTPAPPHLGQRGSPALQQPGCLCLWLPCQAAAHPAPPPHAIAVHAGLPWPAVRAVRAVAGCVAVGVAGAAGGAPGAQAHVAPVVGWQLGALAARAAPARLNVVAGVPSVVADALIALGAALDAVQGAEASQGVLLALCLRLQGCRCCRALLGLCSLALQRQVRAGEARVGHAQRPGHATLAAQLRAAGVALAGHPTASAAQVLPFQCEHSQAGCSGTACQSNARASNILLGLLQFE